MTTFLLGVLVAWLLIGIVASYVMGRRGYDPWSWGVLGALFGPLVVPLALSSMREHRAHREEQTVAAGRSRDGAIRALVGVDGSPEADRAGGAVVELFAERLRHLTLATVIDYDEADMWHQRGGRVFEQEAAALLDHAAARVPGEPTTVVLSGQPAEALVAYARTHDVDVIAVGARGRGLSKKVLGSVAVRLVENPTIPVLVTGRGSG